MKSSKSTFYGLFFLLAFCLSNKVGSQSIRDLRFNNITKVNGLSSNYVNDIVKDKLGFIWIATNDGLCRYDGPDNVTVFRADTTNENGLASSFIQTIFLDSQDNLWIGTRFGGLTRYHLTNHTWQTYLHDATNEQTISHNEILSIQEDKQKRIWVGTENALNLLDIETNTFTRYYADRPNKSGLKGKAVLNIFEDDKGLIWVGTLNGMYLMLQNDADNTISFRYFNPSQQAEAHNIWKIYQDQRGKHWIVSLNGGLILMDLPKDANNQPNQQVWTPIFHNYTVENGSGISSNLVYDVLQDQDNNLWVATMDGLNLVSSKDFLPKKLGTAKPKLNFQPYFHDSSNPKSILGNTVIAMTEDNQGLLWFGTINGVSQFNKHANQFNTFRLKKQIGELSNAQNISLDNQGNLWVVSNKNGLYRCPKKDIANLASIDKKYPNLLLEAQSAVIYTRDGKDLFVGSSAGITRINSQTFEKKQYPVPNWVKENFPDLYIFKLFVDKSGLIWLGTVRGVFTVHPKTGGYKQYIHQANNPLSLSDNAVSDIFQDSNGTIWISTWNGLNRVASNNGETIKFEQFVNQNQPDENVLPINQIHTLQQAGDHLYIGTPKGLFSYNLTTKKFKKYLASDNNASIFNIQEGQDGKLWISCSEGILCFDPSDESFNYFTKEDGAGAGQFRFAAGVQDKARNIYFGSNEGVTFFHPNAIKGNQQIPPVYITEINKISTESTESQAGIAKDKIYLNHQDYYLSVKFAALNYNRPEKNQYTYKLEGFDDQWRAIKFGIPIVYTNLPPNTYQLTVKAANNDGVWNQKGTTLQIVKLPAFWETWWFQIGMILLGVTAILFAGRLYTNSIRKQNEALNKEISERIKAEKELETYAAKLKEFNVELKRSNRDLEQFAYIASHDLKEPLRIIDNFSGLLAQTNQDKLDEDSLIYINFIKDGVKRMSKLINSLLTYSRVGRKEIAFQSINLNQLVKLKVFDLSQQLKDRNTQVTVTPLPEIIGEPEQVGMIFQNLISNALKFNTSAKPLVIIKEEIGNSSDHWQFSVADNGIGIPLKYQQQIFGVFRRLHAKEAFEGTGIGLSVCQKIVFRHQGEIWLESEAGKGTTFHFTIAKQLKLRPQETINMRSPFRSLEV